MCQYSKCHFAGCRYPNCHYADRRGTDLNTFLSLRRDDGESGDASKLRRRRSLPRLPETGMFRLRREHEDHVPPDQYAGRERRQGLLRRLHSG